MSQKESEWENELREMIDGIAAYQHNVGDRAVLLVKKVLSTREKEIADEVEEIQTQLHNGHFEAGYKLTNKLLSILKH